MEKKKLRKLTLKKEEIVNLTDDNMDYIQGGGFTTPGTGLACFTFIGDMMQANSDGPYIYECMEPWEWMPTAPVGGSQNFIDGVCVITD